MLPSPLVSTEWLAAHLELPTLRILDCSVVMRTADDGSYSFVAGRAEYADGHVPGSVFVDVLGELAAKGNPLPLMMPKPEVFATTMASHGVGSGTTVMLYDRSNHAWAARVWWLLRACSFDSAAVLDGGWQKWRAGRRTMSAAPGRYPRGSFEPRFRPRSDPTLFAFNIACLEGVDPFVLAKVRIRWRTPSQIGVAADGRTSAVAGSMAHCLRRRLAGS